MSNLKMQTNSQNSIQMNGQKQHQYARSTSRGKEMGGQAQVSKLSAMLGRPTLMSGRNAVVNNSASTGIVGSSLNGLQARP